MDLTLIQCPAIWMVFWSKGEEQEKAVKDSLEMLKTIEEHGIGEKKYFGGDKIDMVDIAFGQLALWLQVIEDVTRVKLLEASKFPRLQRWIENFRQVPIIKGNLPHYDQMLAFFKGRREMIVASNK